MAQHKGNTEIYSAQCAPLAGRISQAEKMIGDRSERMAQYRKEILDLRRAIEQSSAERPGIERDIETNARRLKDLTLQKRAGEDELAGLEERLDPEQFIRIHRSTILRRDHIRGLRHDGLGVWSAELVNGEALRIGRTYLARVKAMAGR